MSSVLKKIKKKVKKIKSSIDSISKGQKLYNGKTLLEYRNDPEGYAKYVLGIILTPDQLELCFAFLDPPHRVICRAGHIVGKSLLVAFLISWIYDTHENCFIISTAPRLESVRDIVWRELRKIRMRAGLGGFTGPRSLRMESSPTHIAEGVTAISGTAFQGKHELEVYVFIDEAAGVKPEFWEAIHTMTSGRSFGLFAILNPTTTACQPYQEEQSGLYSIKVIRSLDHPNIEAELKGEEAPYPSAVRLATLRTWITLWCDKLSPGDEIKDNDFPFPPEEYATKNDPTIWYRPGPIGEARILGSYPTRGSDTIWTEALFNRAITNQIKLKPTWRACIGCDVARYGSDLTEIIVRIGPCVVYHESHSGWTGDKIAGKLKLLCKKFQGPEEPEQVRVFIDETGGWGTGAIDNAGEFNFIGVNSSCSASGDELTYKNMRTELWFITVEMARQGLVDLTRLPKDIQQELKRQLLAQRYKILPTGQLFAVDKDKMKEEIKRSPDTADALNLSFLTDYSGAHKTEGVLG